MSKSLGGEIQYANPLTGMLPPPLPGSPTSCHVPSKPIMKFPLNLLYKTCEMKYMLETKAVWKITLIFEV